MHKVVCALLYSIVAPLALYKSSGQDQYNLHRVGQVLYWVSTSYMLDLIVAHHHYIIVDKRLVKRDSVT